MSPFVKEMEGNPAFWIHGLNAWSPYGFSTTPQSINYNKLCAEQWTKIFFEQDYAVAAAVSTALPPLSVPWLQTAPSLPSVPVRQSVRYYVRVGLSTLFWRNTLSWIFPKLKFSRISLYIINLNGRQLYVGGRSRARSAPFFVLTSPKKGCTRGQTRYWS